MGNLHRQQPLNSGGFSCGAEFTAHLMRSRRRLQLLLHQHRENFNGVQSGLDPMHRQHRVSTKYVDVWVVATNPYADPDGGIEGFPAPWYPHLHDTPGKSANRGYSNAVLLYELIKSHR